MAHRIKLDYLCYYLLRPQVTAANAIIASSMWAAVWYERQYDDSRELCCVVVLDGDCRAYDYTSWRPCPSAHAATRSYLLSSAQFVLGRASHPLLYRLIPLICLGKDLKFHPPTYSRLLIPITKKFNPLKLTIIMKQHLKTLIKYHN